MRAAAGMEGSAAEGGGDRGWRKVVDVRDEGLDDAIDLVIEKVRRTPLAAQISLMGRSVAG